jgi:type II secretory pathway pseudopilin PulG
MRDTRKGDKIMLRRLTIPEAICAGVLCVFALGTAKAADNATAERDRKTEYQAAIAHAAADYRLAKDGCKDMQGNDRDVCLKQAKADYVKATKKAKARRQSKDSSRLPVR